MRVIVFRIFFLSPILFCLPFCSSEVSSFLSICEVEKTGGLGTKADPFWICDYAGLNNIRNNLSSSYTLLADIDASSTCGGDCSNPSGMGWLPIGDTTGGPTLPNAFSGQFNGNTHTISNLYLEGRTSSSGIGLFGVTSEAQIRELGLVNINIVMSTGDRVGGLVAELHSSRIIRCYTTGSVSLATGGDQYGGLVGEMMGSDIIDSYSEVNIDEVSRAGSAGSTGNNNYGGLIGKASSITLSSPPVHSFVIGSYATGNIIADGASHGGLVGDFSGGGSVTNSYATGDITGDGEGHGGLIGKATSTSSTPSSSPPVHSFVIGSYATGNIISNGDSHGGLVGDFSGGGSVTNSYATGDITGDGEGHGGLIGKATSTSSTPSSSLLPLHSFVIGSYATGNIMGNGDSHGGLIGRASSFNPPMGSSLLPLHSFVIGSYATGNIISNGDSHGGLVGDFSGGGSVTNSYATGNITGNGGSQTGGHGGLVGRMVGGGVLQNNYASGNVTAVGLATMGGLSAWNYGGLVGNFEAVATNNYATGNVSGGSLPSSNYGGLMGNSTGGSPEIENSYTTGSVTSSNNHGGLIGLLGVYMTGFHYFVDNSGGTNGVATGTPCAVSICERQTVANIREVTSSSAPGAWSTGSTQWNLDYGNNSQLPAIKHVQNPSPTGPRWCNDGSRNSAHLSACGSIIYGQR